MRKHTLKHRVDHLKGLIDLFPDFCASENNLATDEDQEDDLRLNHTIDETREQLRLVGAEIVMTRCKTLQADRELDITRANNVLDFELAKFGLKSKLLHNPGVLARR